MVTKPKANIISLANIFPFLNIFPTLRISSFFFYIEFGGNKVN